LEMIKLGALMLKARQARAWQHGKQLCVYEMLQTQKPLKANSKIKTANQLVKRL
jgi:hypothetical protein